MLSSPALLTPRRASLPSFGRAPCCGAFRARASVSLGRNDRLRCSIITQRDIAAEGTAKGGRRGRRMAVLLALKKRCATRKMPPGSRAFARIPRVFHICNSAAAYACVRACVVRSWRIVTHSRGTPEALRAEERNSNKNVQHHTHSRARTRGLLSPADLYTPPGGPIASFEDVFLTVFANQR